MMYKNQLIVFVVSFLIVGFLILSNLETSFAGVGQVVACCQETASSCFDASNQPCLEQDFRLNEICNVSTGQCEPIRPIPTLNQWGKIITIAVIGLFALIGLIIMRRRSGVKS
jgi:hypothetical protein